MTRLLRHHEERNDLKMCTALTVLVVGHPQRHMVSCVVSRSLIVVGKLCDVFPDCRQLLVHITSVSSNRIVELSAL